MSYDSGLTPGGGGGSGADGRSIVSIDRTAGDGSPGTMDTYTITYSYGSTSTFEVTNGHDGTPGPPGSGSGGRALPSPMLGTGNHDGKIGGSGSAFSDGVATGQNSRVPFLARSPLGVCVLRFPGFACTTNHDEAPPNDFTIMGAAVEAGGVVRRVTFDGGSSTKLVRAGVSYVVSDPVIVNATKGTAVWVRAFVQARDSTGSLISGGKWPQLGQVLTDATYGAWTATGTTDLSQGTGTTGLTQTGSSPNPYTTLGLYTYDPDPVRAVPAVLVVGDSITAPSASWADLCLDGAGLGYYCMARGGENSQTFGLIGAQAVKRLASAHGFTHAVFAYGRNDLNTFPSYAAFLTRLRLTWTLLRNLGIDFIAAATIPPRSTSTDSFATLAGQTTDASDAVRQQYNTALRSGGFPGEVDAYLDLASYCEAPTDRSKWAVNGTANYATADGEHPTTVIHTAAGTGLTPVAASTFVF